MKQNRHELPRIGYIEIAMNVKFGTQQIQWEFDKMGRVVSATDVENGIKLSRKPCGDWEIRKHLNLT